MRLFAAVCALAVAASGSVMAQAPDLKKLDLVMKAAPDGPVIQVNGVGITRDEFGALYGAELSMAAMRTRQTPTDAVRLRTGLHCVTILVEREILRQEAQKRKVTVTDAELQKSWKDQLEQMRKALSKGNAGDISEEDLLKKAGADKDKAMGELRETLMIEKMRELVAKEKGVKVTEAEVKAFYEQNKQAMARPEGVHLQRIYVNTRNADAAKKGQGRERIEKALSRIQAGESFDAVARAVTDAPDKEKGGDPGMLAMSALPESYVKQLGTMKPGEISPVFEDELGFHLIKLLDVMQGGEVTLEKAQPMIKAQLMRAKLDAAVKSFCQPFLQKPGYVQVNLQLDKVLAAHPQAEQLRKEVLGDMPVAERAPDKPAAATKPAAKPAAGKSAAPAKAAQKAAPAKGKPASK